MDIQLHAGEMLPPSKKREQVFDLVFWYGPLEVPTRGLTALFRPAPTQDPMELALLAFKQQVRDCAPEANYVLCTRIERTLVPAENGPMWAVLITGSPAVVIDV